MAIQRMDHVGVVVSDLAAATEFFVALGLEHQGTMSLADEAVDRIVGLRGVSDDFAFFKTPDGHGTLEVIQFHSPPADRRDVGAPANALGLRHLCFAVDDLEATIDRLRPHGAELVGEVVDWGDSYKLCYLRGPDGIIVELAEQLG